MAIKVKGRRRRKLETKPRPRKYLLKELVDDISARIRHPETDWGRPIGKETW
jgi:antitoxin component of MazEF toxin-antitoxin module